MFWLSMTFLICLACLIVLWVDMPNLQEKAAEAFGAASRTGEIPVLATSSPIRAGIERTVVLLLVLIWPIVFVESIFHWCTRPWDKQTRKYHWFAFMFCLCPALRMWRAVPNLASGYGSPAWDGGKPTSDCVVAWSGTSACR